MKSGTQSSTFTPFNKSRPSHYPKFNSCRGNGQTSCRAADTQNIHHTSSLPSNASSIPSIPQIPSSLQGHLASARRSWLNRCIDSPLVDPATNSRVHIHGITHFAPHGGAEGLANLRRLIDQIQPDVLAIEQPFDLAARAGLPYPETLHHLAALLPTACDTLAGPPYPAQGPGAAAARLPAAGLAESRDAVVRRLRALLPGLAHPARVGRDLLDPFEVLGFYGGCDYVTRPEQLVEVLELFGHLPGLEYAAAAVAAQEQGVQVYSVDAPLRLQETWVAQLVAGFSLAEADLARRLQVELDRAQEPLPPEYRQWDASVAEAVRRMELARLAQGANGNVGASVGDAGSGSRSEGGKGAEREREVGPSEAAIAAFKVVRAVAAATVSYERCHEAFARQARLQPLKFGLFARRARHLVLQVRDLCQRMTVRQVRMDASALRVGPLPSPPGVGVGAASTTTAKGNGIAAQQHLQQHQQHQHQQNLQQQQQQKAYFEISDQQSEQVVLLVAGRQYMPYIEELWANERSVLWHGDVPRTFTATTRIEPQIPSAQVPPSQKPAVRSSGPAQPQE